jgi:bacterial/archaeal transporter family protein
VTVRWLLPTLLYVVLIGGLGVASKLALRDLAWQDLIVWTTVGYVFVAVTMLLGGHATLGLGDGTGWAMLAGALAISGLIALYIALGMGEASKVVPVSAAYPAVTLLLSALVLSESVSLARAGGMTLVVAGVIVLTAAR